MPSALARSCTTNGCPNTTTAPGGGKCEDCNKAKYKAYDDRRGSRHERGYGARWERVAAGLRRRQLRWCGQRMPGAPMTADSTCPQEGLSRVLTEVIDHIVPVKGAHDPRFWDSTNWQGLCRHDHDRKRQRESMAARGVVV